MPSSSSEPPRKREPTTRETLGGGHLIEIIAKPKGGCHEEGRHQGLATVPPELKDNEVPSEVPSLLEASIMLNGAMHSVIMG
jgi:hypothetical protein